MLNLLTVFSVIFVNSISEFIVLDMKTLRVSEQKIIGYKRTYVNGNSEMIVNRTIQQNH